MTIPKKPQTHDIRRSIEDVESKRRLALRLALKHSDINHKVSRMTGHMAPQNLDLYFFLAMQGIEDDE